MPDHYHNIILILLLYSVKKNPVSFVWDNTWGLFLGGLGGYLLQGPLPLAMWVTVLLGCFFAQFPTVFLVPSHLLTYQTEHSRIISNLRCSTNQGEQPVVEMSAHQSPPATTGSVTFPQSLPTYYAQNILWRDSWYRLFFCKVKGQQENFGYLDPSHCVLFCL